MRSSLSPRLGTFKDRTWTLLRSARRERVLSQRSSNFHLNVGTVFSPEFIEDQLNRSLERLELSTLDVLLLHNPEYFRKTSDAEDEYYARIERAFRHLEGEVEKGRIQYYGISSNTFPAEEGSAEFTSLEKVVAIADTIRPDHHFRVIQFPMNLMERGAVVTKNNSGKSVLEVAQEHDLATLVNRPLNAFTGQKMVRLADFPSHDETTLEDNLHSALDLSTEVEKNYPNFPGMPYQPIALGHYLKENFEKVADIIQWRDFISYQVGPIIKSTFVDLDKHAPKEEWTRLYQGATVDLITTVTEILEHFSSEASRDVAGRLEKKCVSLATSKSLSQKVLRTYVSAPGVHCVLLGMRTPSYVQDAKGLTEMLSVEDSMRILTEGVLK